MSYEHYTIDDIIRAVQRRGITETALDSGSLIFYIHMAYALGMGFQPSPLYARIAELEHLHGDRPLRGADGIVIPPIVMP